MSDILIIGGGVIGLSIAYELAGTGRRVQLVERGTLGREASWAGAGILPPPATRKDVPAWQRLKAISYALHQPWSEQLKAESDIDNGYRVCGALHVARHVGEAAALRADMSELAADGVRVEPLADSTDVRQLEPRISADNNFQAAFHLPDEAQIRNPDHLRALAVACRRRGVAIDEQTEVTSFRTDGSRVLDVISSRGKLTAETVVITAGAWSELLLRELNLSAAVYPVRGQMLLYRCDAPPTARIINEGPRYIVPRGDGRVLVGSTEEDVGFNKQNTDAGIRDLRHFAEELLPCLQQATIEKTWAGLRPHAVDGFPYLGRAAHLANCFVAAGHYRAGLTTSTGTAVLMRQLIADEPTEIDIEEFRLDR